MGSYINFITEFVRVPSRHIPISVLVFLTKVLHLFHWLVPGLRFGIIFLYLCFISLIYLIIGPSDKYSFILHNTVFI